MTLDNAMVAATEEESVARGLTTNPKVLLAQADVKVSEAEIDKEAAPLYPRLDLEVIGNNNRHNNGREDTTYSATFLLVARYNLYRGGADLARVREFKWRKAEAQEQLRVQERAVAEDVRLSWSARDTQRNRVADPDRPGRSQPEHARCLRAAVRHRPAQPARSAGRDQRAVPVQERPDHRELRRALRQLPHPGLAGPAGAGDGRRLPDRSDPGRSRVRDQGAGRGQRRLSRPVQRLTELCKPRVTFTRGFCMVERMQARSCRHTDSLLSSAHECEEVGTGCRRAPASGFCALRERELPDDHRAADPGDGAGLADLRHHGRSVPARAGRAGGVPAGRIAGAARWTSWRIASIAGC